MHDWNEIRTNYGGLVFATSYRILGYSFKFNESKLVRFAVQKPNPLPDNIEITDNGDGSWTQSVKSSK